jgi:hypothetical protein
MLQNKAKNVLLLIPNNSPFSYGDLLIRKCWHLIFKGDETNWDPLAFTSISMSEKIWRY